MRPAVFILLLSLMSTGCVTRRMGSPATEAKLFLRTPSPERYTIRVGMDATTDYRVSSDGRVAIHIPKLGPGCRSDLFGAIKVYDKSPFTWKAIRIMKNEQVVRGLSLKQFSRLAIDSDGYRTIKI